MALKYSDKGFVGCLCERNCLIAAEPRKSSFPCFLIFPASHADPRPGREVEDSADGLGLIWGKINLMERLCGLQFVITPLSFFQTNPKQTEILYNVVACAAGKSLVTCTGLLPAAVPAASSHLDMHNIATYPALPQCTAVSEIPPNFPSRAGLPSCFAPSPGGVVTEWTGCVPRGLVH